MPVKSSAPKFAVGDTVTFDLDGTDVTGEIQKLKGGNYVVETPDGESYECEPHELTAAEEEKPAKKKKAAAEEEGEEEKPAKKKKADPEEEEPAPAKKKAGTKSDDGEDKPAKKKVSGWNATPASENKGGNVGFPIGQWEALAFNGVAEEKGKGVNVYLEYVGVHDDDVTGKTQRQYFTIKDDKGAWTEGVSILKGNLITLGFTEEQINDLDEDEIVDELNKLLKKLRKMEPWVTIRVKEGQNGYTKLYLNGLMDDQDDKPENPLSE